MKAAIQFPTARSKENDPANSQRYRQAAVEELLAALPVLMDTIERLMVIDLAGPVKYTQVASPAFSMILRDLDSTTSLNIRWEAPYLGGISTELSESMEAYLQTGSKDDTKTVTFQEEIHEPEPLRQPIPDYYYLPEPLFYTSSEEEEEPLHIEAPPSESSESSYEESSSEEDVPEPVPEPPPQPQPQPQPKPFDPLKDMLGITTGVGGSSAGATAAPHTQVGLYTGPPAAMVPRANLEQTAEERVANVKGVMAVSPAPGQASHGFGVHGRNMQVALYANNPTARVAAAAQQHQEQQLLLQRQQLLQRQRNNGIAKASEQNIQQEQVQFQQQHSHNPGAGAAAYDSRRQQLLLQQQQQQMVAYQSMQQAQMSAYHTMAAYQAMAAYQRVTPEQRLVMQGQITPAYPQQQLHASQMGNYYQTYPQSTQPAAPAIPAQAAHNPPPYPVPAANQTTLNAHTAVPAMPAQQVAQDPAAYRVSSSNATDDRPRVNSSDKAFGSIVEEMKKR